MQQKSPTENFFGDIQSTFKKILSAAPAGYPFDIRTVLETQRKNIQALTEANQLALQGWKSLAQRQTEMVSKFVQDNSNLARQTFVEGKPEEKIAAQTDIIKSYYEHSVANTQELADLVIKSTHESADIINQRVVATLNEIKASAQKAD